MTIDNNALINKLAPGISKSLNEKLSIYGEVLADKLINKVFIDILSRSSLDIKTREIATIAALIAKGNSIPQLKLHYKAALNVGVTHEEILELILQMFIYVGMPSMLNALDLFNGLIDGEIID